MKKVLALLLALVMVLALVACAAKPAEDNTPAETPAENTPAETPAENTEVPEGFKVGFITLHDENSTYDLNFINAATPGAARRPAAFAPLGRPRGLSQENLGGAAAAAAPDAPPSPSAAVLGDRAPGLPSFLRTQHRPTQSFGGTPPPVVVPQAHPLPAVPPRPTPPAHAPLPAVPQYSCQEKKKI